MDPSTAVGRPCLVPLLALLLACSPSPSPADPAPAAPTSRLLVMSAFGASWTSCWRLRC